MAAAIASRLSGRRIRKGIAMTGEITLSGRVLPVGGVAEKIMAAHRAGIHTVLFPAANQMDIETIPEEVRAGLKLIPVSLVAEVFEHVLEPPASPGAQPGLVH